MTSFSFRKIISLMLVNIPVFFCTFVYAVYPNVYVPVLKISISNALFSFGTLAWTVFWISCSSIRGACDKHPLSKVAFYLVPCLPSSLLVFAQWHVFLSMILLAAAVGLCVCVAVRCTYRTVGTRFHILSRCCVSICAGLLIIPALISTFQYDLRGPTYAVSRELLASLAQPDDTRSEETDLFEANRDFIMQLHPEQWEKQDLNGKLELVQALADFECLRFGIPSVRVIGEPLTLDTLGQYNSTDNTISINISYLDSEDSADMVSTLTHECHHAYATWVTDNTDWGDPLTNTPVFNQAREWKENSEHYISSYADYTAYQNQPLERDARIWSAEETERIVFYWSA